MEQTQSGPGAIAEFASSEVVRLRKANAELVAALRAVLALALPHPADTDKDRERYQLHIAAKVKSALAKAQS